MSIPSLFFPVVYGDSLLIDGGLLNNLPTDVVREMGSEVVIAVNVGRPKKTKEELVHLKERFLSRRAAIKKVGSVATATGLAFLGLCLPGISQQKAALACCSPSNTCSPCGTTCGAGCTDGDCASSCSVVCAPGVGVASPEM